MRAVAGAVANLLMFSLSFATLQGQKALSWGEQDEALAAIRQYALNYVKSLPDYTCTRVTQREIGYVYGKHRWSLVIEEELSVAGQRETYRVLKVDNNLPPHLPQPDPVLSIISVGEFGSVLDRIFDPATGAGFHWDRSGKLRGRPVIVFSFDVPRAHGAHIYDRIAKHDIVVGFQGLVFADAASMAVMRVETRSSDFPEDSVFTGMDLALDYQAARLGDREFVLPYRFELNFHNHNWFHGVQAPENDQESSVYAEYKNYRVLSAQSAVTFDGPDSQNDVHSAITFGGVVAPEQK